MPMQRVFPKPPSDPADPREAFFSGLHWFAFPWENEQIPFKGSKEPRFKKRGIKKCKEGDCIPLAPAPHSSPP